MFDNMPRPRPQHLHREINRHGTPVWFVRIGHGPRTRIRSAFGTPEFEAEYQAALAGKAPRKPKDKTGTLAWLIERYRETNAWTSLALETRQKRGKTFFWRCLSHLGISHSCGLQRRRLLLPVTVARRFKPSTSWTPSEVCFVGRLMLV